MNIHSFSSSFFFFLCFSLFLSIHSYDIHSFPCVSILCFNHENPGRVGLGGVDDLSLSRGLLLREVPQDSLFISFSQES